VATFDGTAYLAPEGFLDELLTELGEVRAVHERLVLADGPPRPCSWVRNVWYEPRTLRIQSIGDGAGQLREIQRNWVGYTFQLKGRSELLQEKLPYVSGKPVSFPADPPKAPLGSWTLLERDLLLAAPRCSSPFPHGELRFVEDREGPPSRAYLKLWDAFTRLGDWPGSEARCIDLGSSPGGWTWALAQLGAVVLSVDKAPLDPAVEALPSVEHWQESAFGIDPDEIGPIDWLCSDVICYPKRLLQLVERWLESGHCENFVCTIKFQGETDHGIARAFAEIPGSQVVHLAHNKHELTWLRQKPGGADAPLLYSPPSGESE
jgi:23S rRNA (cytidine2498-2'-O)-methyltransferase